MSLLGDDFGTAVVSFPTVGGVISKVWGVLPGSLLGATAALLTLWPYANEPQLFLFSGRTGIGFCTGLRAFYQ